MDWDDDSYVSCDVETSGTQVEYALQPWRVKKGDAWITSLAWVYRENGQTKRGGMVNPTVFEIAAFLCWCIDTGRTLVGWNIQFDLQWFMAHEGLIPLVYQCHFMDGMLVWRHLEIEPEYESTGPSKKSYSLKTAVREFLPQHAGYEEGIDFHSTDPAVVLKRFEYNVKDCFFTLRLTKQFYAALKPRQRQAMLIEAQCLAMVAEANLKGMYVDTIAASWLSATLKKTAATKLASLAPFGVTEKVVRSPIQMAKLLFDDWKLPVLKLNTSKKTGKSTRSTDKEVLHELAFADPRAKELRDFREALNNDTKFAMRPIESVRYCDDNGWSHPQARVFGTYSGRLTYSSKQGVGTNAKPIGWALHQEKRGRDFRAVVTAPVGYDIVEFDAAGQEFRWMALATQDPVMMQLCQPGEDPHSFMGSRIDHSDYQAFMAFIAADDKAWKPKRQLGKVANLSLQYRTSWRKLRVVARVQYDIPMTEQEAQFIRQVYLNTYVGVPQYWGTAIQEVMRKGYAETFAGRRVRVKGDWNGDNGWSMGSTAINYKIQGTGADQKYLAMMMIRDYLPTIGARFLLDLHDGIYLLVPTSKAKAAAKHIKDMLDNLPYASCWGVLPSIPMPWDCKIGKTWGDLKAFHP